jgi:S1-C subfamily serine protease
MFGLNWVDAIVTVLLVLAVIEGVRIGLLTQLFVVTGFFSALFIAGWLFPHVLPLPNGTTRIAINATCVLLSAIYTALRSFDLAQNIHWSLHLDKRFSERKIKTVEAALGSLTGAAAGLALVWLLGVAIGRMPFAGLSNSVSDSRIIQGLTHILPPVPAVFAQFDRHIDPNAQPYVFTQPGPSASFDYSVSDVAQAESKASKSVTRITGFGCGGIVSGTGFSVGKHLVATNAHVIAGIKRNIIKYNGSSYEAMPVSFDTELDLAILYVPKLNVPALPLTHSLTALGATVAVLGFPGGNYQATPGLLRDTLAVSARSIYDQGTSGRGIYVIQTHVDYGSSGSPAVTRDGRVVGIVFSKPADFPDYAYALTSPHIVSALHKIKTPYQRVGVGACMVN